MNRMDATGFVRRISANIGYGSGNSNMSCGSNAAETSSMTGRAATDGSGGGLAGALEQDRRPGELLVPLAPADLRVDADMIARGGQRAASEDRDAAIVGRQVVDDVATVGRLRIGDRADHGDLLPVVALGRRDDVGDGR